VSYYNTLDKICQSLEGGICKKIAEDKKKLIFNEIKLVTQII